MCNRYMNLYISYDHFGMDVSYGSFSMLWKRHIFDQLLNRVGARRFDEICKTLLLTDKEIIDFVCTPTDYFDLADEILPKPEIHVAHIQCLLSFLLSPKVCY